MTPDVFVPLAERLGRIVQLTSHVLDLALAEVAAGLDVPVSVNISPHDLVNGELPQLVLERLEAYSLSPEILMLELTEHAALEAKTDVLKAIAEAGVAISIDDFGRGWSSLETLKLLPARDLKLDRSYVERVVRGPHRTRRSSGPRSRWGTRWGWRLSQRASRIRWCSNRCVVSAVISPRVYHLARPMDAQALRSWLAQHRSGLGFGLGLWL